MNQTLSQGNHSRDVVQSQRNGRKLLSKWHCIFLFWIFGLYVVFLSPAPVHVTPLMQQKYDERLQKADKLGRDMSIAMNDYTYQRLFTNEAKVWFWRFRPQHREIVNERKQKEIEARKIFQEKQKQQFKALSEAKAELGLWTEAGVSESRTLFWKSYRSGKIFAQRQTLSDALVSLLFYRNTDVVGEFLWLLLTACVNFTSGMIVSLFVFMLRLPLLISSFQPSWLSGISFFLVSVIGGVSVITSILLLLYGSMTIFIFSIATPVSSRLEYQQRRQRYIRQQRFHQD